MSLVAERLEVALVDVRELTGDGGKLVLRAGVGWRPAVAGCERVEVSPGSTLQVAEPVIVHDIATETRFSASELLCEYGVVSGLSVPIQGASGLPYGVLGAYKQSPRAFSAGDVSFVQAVASILAPALARADMEDPVLIGPSTDIHTLVRRQGLV